MASPRDIRRLAFQAIYQLDIRGAGEIDAITEGMEQLASDDPASFSPAERTKALKLALDAFAGRAQADAQIAELAPTWPAYRQPALDRAIVRLAIYEMTSGTTGAKIAVNEAVELAKKYSTEKSPSFVNGVLDKVLKQVLAEQAQGEPALSGANPPSDQPEPEPKSE